MNYQFLLTIPGRGDLAADVTAAGVFSPDAVGLDLSTVYTTEELAEVLGYVTAGLVTITVRSFGPREIPLVESLRVFQVWMEVEGVSATSGMGPSRRTFQRGR